LLFLNLLVQFGFVFAPLFLFLPEQPILLLCGFKKLFLFLFSDLQRGFDFFVFFSYFFDTFFGFVYCILISCSVLAGLSISFFFNGFLNFLFFVDFHLLDLLF